MTRSQRGRKIISWIQGINVFLAIVYASDCLFFAFYPPLPLIAAYGNLRMLEKGLSHMSMADVKSDSNSLYAAIINNREDVVEALLKNGYDANEIYPEPLTHIVIWHNQNAILKLLLDYGADANGIAYRDRGLSAPLVMAIGHENLAAVTLLRDHGASPKVNGSAEILATLKFMESKDPQFGAKVRAIFGM